MEINNKRFITYCAGDKNPDAAALLLLYVNGHIYNKKWFISCNIWFYVITNVQLPTAALAIQYLFVLRPMRNHKQISCDNIVQSCDPAQCPKT